MSISHQPRCSKTGIFSRWQRGLAIVLACALLNACTTVQSVPQTDFVKITSLVRVGDTATCTLRDNSQVLLKITSVEPDVLVGEHRSVPVADIVHVEIRRFSSGKTVLLCAAVVLGLVAVAGIAYAAHPMTLGPLY
jgi:hypothetical protein